MYRGYVRLNLWPILACMLLSLHARTQDLIRRSAPLLHKLENFITPDGHYIIERAGCKNYVILDSFLLNGLEPVRTPQAMMPEALLRKPLLQVHGNVMYALDYRSRIDTPYAESDIYQHTVQTYLDITVKDAYPVRVYFTTRFSNSNLFKRFSDLNLGFNAAQFNQLVRQRIKQQLQGYIRVDSLIQLKKQVDEAWAQLQQLKQAQVNPAVLQRQVEANEHARFGKPPVQLIPVSLDVEDVWAIKRQTNSSYIREKLNALGAVSDSLPVTENNPQKKEQQIDSLERKLMSLQDRYAAARRKVADYRQALSNATNNLSGKALTDKLDSLQIPDSILPKGYKQLMAIRSFNIGRTLVDYSELSAKNLSVTGLQIEYNPSYYIAVAAGTVDYRFRDYIVSANKGPRQYAAIIRAGWGNKEASNIILTYYTGKRQLFNAVSSQGSTIPNYSLMGFTIEGNYKVAVGTYLSAEVAKSSVPYYTTSGAHQGNLFASATQFNDHSNEAYAFKVNSYWAKTNTKFSGFYRHYGANFQSFSLFTTGASQSAWQARVDQALFHKRLLVTASIKENDYTNPYVEHTFKSNAVFKSIQATLRLKKLPVLSIGYFPSSQLTKISDDHFSENLFYTFMASATHYYKLCGVQMNTALVYTQFYNHSTDSGFVYFNTKNLLLNHAMFIGKWTFQSMIAVASNTDYQLYTYGADAALQCRSWLRVGAGAKYNKQTKFEITQLGYNANLQLQLKQLGELQITAEKGYIPGMNKQLVENTTGRVSFLKIF